MHSDKQKASEAARELSKLGSSKGGKARAAALAPSERSAIARRAARARWGVVGSDEGTLPESASVASSSLRSDLDDDVSLGAVPSATHVGLLMVGGLRVQCSVLSDGVRLITSRGVKKAFGSKKIGGSEAEDSGMPGIPPFQESKSKIPYNSDQ